MHAMNREQGAPEGPFLDSSSSSSVAVVLDQRLGTVQSFANAMTENILHSVVNRLEKTQSGEDWSACSDASDLEKPPASATTEEATVREACRGPMPRDASSSLNTEMEMEVSSDAPSDPPLQNPALQASARARPHHPSLSQSGLPAAGSLDYPDAPPTTPLLPELMRSRESFARKLKGGLAKEFSPSPPPSTPKNEENKAEGLMMDESQAAADADARIDFVKRLVVSLSAGAGEGGGEWRERTAGSAPDSYGGGDGGAGPPGRLEMAVFAEVLSGEIVDWVTNHYPSLVGGGFTEQAEGDGDIQCLADRLAETIISSTMRDITMHV